MSVATTTSTTTHRHIQTMAPHASTKESLFSSSSSSSSSSTNNSPFLVGGGVGSGSSGGESIYEIGFQTVCHDAYDFVTANPWPILGCLFLLGCLYCTRPQVPDERYRGRFGRIAREIIREQKELAKAAKTTTIEESVTIKVIINKDYPNCGDLLLGDDSESPEEAMELGQARGGGVSSEEEEEDTTTTTTTTNEEEDDEEEEESECVICLEPFELGDRVAFSNYSKGCRHVFHLECIRSWLQEACHDDCPSCRSPLLPKTRKVPETNSADPEEENVNHEVVHEEEDIEDSSNNNNNNNNGDEEAPTTMLSNDESDNNNNNNNNETDALLQGDEEAPIMPVTTRSCMEVNNQSEQRNEEEEEEGAANTSFQAAEEDEDDNNDDNDENDDVTYVILRGQDSVSILSR